MMAMRVILRIGVSHCTLEGSYGKTTNDAHTKALAVVWLETCLGGGRCREYLGSVLEYAVRILLEEALHLACLPHTLLDKRAARWGPACSAYVIVTGIPVRVGAWSGVQS